MILKLPLLLISIAVSFSAFGNEVRQFSLDEKVHSSDLIFIGVTKETDQNPQSTAEIRRASRLEIVKLYKGGSDKSSTVSLVTRGFIVELDPDCCVERKSYLVFARQAADDYFISTNGPFGTYEVKDGVVVKWPHSGNIGPVRATDVEKQLMDILDGP